MISDAEKDNIEIGKETLKSLNITRKWTMFLSITGFIFLGIAVLVGVIAGTFLSAFNSGETNSGISESLMFVIFFVVVVICIFPGIFLFRFSKHAAKAVSNNDKVELHKALINLKTYFVFFGVQIILIVTLYLAALILTGTSVSFLKGF